jgi:hypothetical protein
MFKKWILRIRDGRDHLTASAVMLKISRTPLSEKLQKMCGQKQKNMWSKLKKNTAKKTV